MMRRRKFITLLGGAAAAMPVGVRAQQPAFPVIGFLNQEAAELTANNVTGFRKGLSETGFVENQNVTIEYRWAEDRYEQLPQFAADLVNHKVAVIVAAYFPSAVAAKTATLTIPIVFICGVDPVAAGLVASLNRPGGNLTGLTNYNVSLTAKRLELQSRAGFRLQPTKVEFVVNLKTAKSLGIELPTSVLLSADEVVE